MGSFLSTQSLGHIFLLENSTKSLDSTEKRPDIAVPDSRKSSIAFFLHNLEIFLLRPGFISKAGSFSILYARQLLSGKNRLQTADFQHPILLNAIPQAESRISAFQSCAP